MSCGQDGTKHTASMIVIRRAFEVHTLSNIHVSLSNTHMQCGAKSLEAIQRGELKYVPELKANDLNIKVIGFRSIG